MTIMSTDQRGYTIRASVNRRGMWWRWNEEAAHLGRSVQHPRGHSHVHAPHLAVTLRVHPFQLPHATQPTTDQSSVTSHKTVLVSLSMTTRSKPDDTHKKIER